MKFENVNNGGTDVSDAVSKILGIKDEIMTTGAADSESSAIDEIVNGLKSGDIKPADGLRKVREILESRQDYH